LPAVSWVMNVERYLEALTSGIVADVRSTETSQKKSSFTKYLE